MLLCSLFFVVEDLSKMCHRRPNPFYRLLPTSHTTMALGIVARQTTPQKSRAKLHFIMEPVHPEHGID
jgi:hypothetical protein